MEERGAPLNRVSQSAHNSGIMETPHGDASRGSWRMHRVMRMTTRGHCSQLGIGVVRDGHGSPGCLT